MNPKTVFLVLLSMATWRETLTRNPQLTSTEEAEYIALETTNSLLPDAALVKQIAKDVALIRKQRPEVANSYFKGRKFIGKLEIPGYTKDIEGKINKGKFGPISKAEKGGVVVFQKRFNPTVLAEELEKMGISGDPIWIEGPDYGGIEYNKDESTYTFREGLENCKPECTANKFFVYKIDSKGKAILQGQHATLI